MIQAQPAVAAVVEIANVAEFLPEGTVTALGTVKPAAEEVRETGMPALGALAVSHTVPVVVSPAEKLAGAAVTLEMDWPAPIAARLKSKGTRHLNRFTGSPVPQL